MLDQWLSLLCIVKIIIFKIIFDQKDRKFVYPTFYQKYFPSNIAWSTLCNKRMLHSLF